MSNEEIIDALELTAKLMELHEGDTFKIKNYSTTAFSLNKLIDIQLANCSIDDLTKLQSVGKSTATKIVEFVQTGYFKELDDLLEQTPSGVLEMFKVKGIGPKKIAVIWRELGIEDLRELQIACESGKIAKLKGFGEGTQQKILDSLAFMQSQVGKLRMDKAEALAQQIKALLSPVFERVEIAGQVRRRSEIVDTLVLIIATNEPVKAQQQINVFEDLVQDVKHSSPFIWRGKAFDLQVLVELVCVKPDQFESQYFILSADQKHLAERTPSGQSLMQVAYNETIVSDEDVYQKANLPFIVPEMREGLGEFEWAINNKIEDLVTWNDLRGILHNHSTYSDGKHSLERMATFCKELGFEYLGIADHSKSAGYANGLSVERVMEQHREIEKLNQQLAPFKILKGIEADILGDGSLDYDNEILATFDYVVASVHSNLTMNYDKAMSRLIRAIENPYTTILGHPTGRLLLSREGYPIDHKLIVDACAANNVVIEINASPWRLDIDWRWIRYCIEKNVMLSINPDAHETNGYFDMHYGVSIGRKGGLTKNMTFNALTLTEIEAFLKK